MKNKLVLEGNEELLEGLQKLWKSGELQNLVGLPILGIRSWENLNQWNSNISGEDWQLSEPGFRSNSSTTRYKQIELGDYIFTLSLSLDLSYSHEAGIEIQASSTDSQCLPEGLQLIVTDEFGETIAQARSLSRKNHIGLELECSGVNKFRVELVLGNLSKIENFFIDNLELDTQRAIELDEVNLSEWFDGLFLGGWNPGSQLTGYVNSSEKVQANKIIVLGNSIEVQTVILSLQQERMSNHEIDICLQLYPFEDSCYVPEGLLVTVLDESGKSIPELEAKARIADSYLQLQFTGDQNDRFCVVVTLGNISVTKKFLI